MPPLGFDGLSRRKIDRGLRRLIEDGRVTLDGTDVTSMSMSCARVRLL